MRRERAILAVVGTVLLMAAVPSSAAATYYKVTNKSGRTVGRVVPGPVPDQGDRIGVVRNLTRFRGAVYSRQTRSGHVGWPVSNGSGYVAWVKKAITRRFVLAKLPGGPAVFRATKLSSGRWLAQKKVKGRWATVGRIQKGCPRAVGRGSREALAPVAATQPTLS